MDSWELCQLSAREMAAMIRSREISAVELLGAHLDQVHRLNPHVNAIITLVEDQAREAAAEADKKTLSGAPLGILHGLPMAHKDTHRTKGIRTTFGSPIYFENVPDTDDLIIERLHEAGVITTGKTNTPEFAAGSHTFNSIFGTTRNPYDLSRTPGGSSGGAAVALALGMQPLADGSDMGGSLRNPASFCNVVGLRPSFGRVPNVPSIIPNELLSVPGPMARSVSDVALMMEAIAGPDPRAKSVLPDPASSFADIFNEDPTPRRIAWLPDLDGLIGVNQDVADALSGSPKVFSDLGWEIVEIHPDFELAEETFRVIRAAQFARVHGENVDKYPELIKESIKWNVAVGRALSSDQIDAAIANQQLLIEQMRKVYETVDLLALPVSQVTPFPIEWEYPIYVGGREMGDYLGWMASCYLISVTQLPAISLPAAFTPDGLPVGLQLVGPPRGDVDLLRAASVFELATQVGQRRPPMIDHAPPEQRGWTAIERRLRGRRRNR